MGKRIAMALAAAIIVIGLYSSSALSATLNWALPPALDYDDIQPYTGLVSTVAQGELFGLIDYQGNLVQPIEYVDIDYDRMQDTFYGQPKGGMIGGPVKAFDKNGAVSQEEFYYHIGGGGFSPIYDMTTQQLGIADQAPILGIEHYLEFLEFEYIPYRDYYIVSAEYYEAIPVEYGDETYIEYIPSQDRSVNNDPMYGYVDRQGNLLFPCDYYSGIKDFSEGLAAVHKGGEWVIETSGMYFTGGQWGFLDTSGNSVTGYIYDDVYDFHNGLAAACKDGLWGYINTNGETVIDFTLEAARPFEDEGLAWAKQGGRWGVLSLPGAAVNGLPAQPTASAILLDGASTEFEAYLIDNNNYFKLRDLAYALSGTAGQFQVAWDAAANAIYLTDGQAYTAVGGEMTVNRNPQAVTAQPTAAKVLVDGREVDLIAYNINGSNYFKLRDIASVIGFGVDWDAASNTVIISTD